MIHCSACTERLLYDGRDDGLIVYNGSHAMSLQLLVAFDRAMYVNGSTLSAFSIEQQLQYEDRHGADYFALHKERVLTRQRLGHLVHAYRLLFDWSSVDHLLVCPDCGPHPSHLVGDGTALGVPRALARLQMDDWRRIVTGVVKVGRGIEDLNFLPTSQFSDEFYSLLVRFIRAPPASPSPSMRTRPLHTANQPPLSDDEAEKLYTDFERAEHPRVRSLAPAIKFAIENPYKHEDGRMSCDTALAHALYPLVTDSATVVAFEPAKHAELIERLLASTSIADVKDDMKSLMPWLYNCFRDSAWDVLEKSFRPCLQALAEFADALSKWEQKYVVTALGGEPKTLAQLTASVVAEERDAAARIVQGHARVDRSSSESIGQDLDSGAWFGPGFRTCLGGIFEYEKGTNFNQHRMCSKSAPSSSAHTPGIFSALCPHGYPIAVVLMRSGESPAYIFDLILSRYPDDKKPKICVYDNACNAWKYAIAREPQAFSVTRFLVDRLHWPNHTRCATTFRMAEFSQYDEVVEFLNSQRAEQCVERNSRCRRGRAPPTSQVTHALLSPRLPRSRVAGGINS
jgi:hypothetical protein